MSKTPVTKRVLGLDGVRAAACLGVICAHFFQETGRVPSNPFEVLLFAGGTGVQVFFVLSGFLLSLPFWKAYSAKSPMPSLGLYAVSRLGRIVPAYYCCVIILSIIHGTLATKWGIFSTFTLLSFTNSFFRATFMPEWDKALWSIGIEVQFYVLLPLFAIGMFRCRSAGRVRLYCVATMAALAVGQYVLLLAAPAIERLINEPAFFEANAWATRRNVLVLFAHFLFGFLAADLYRSLASRAAKQEPLNTKFSRFAVNRYDWVAVTVLVALAVLLITANPDRFPYRIFDHLELGWPVFPGLVAILLGVLPFSRKIGPCLDNRFLQWTAKLSFAIYLWHLPIMMGLHHYLWPDGFQTGLDRLLFIGATLCCVYAVAQCSYSLIELPALNWVQRYKDNRKTRTSAASPDPNELRPLAQIRVLPFPLKHTAAKIDLQSVER